MVPEGIDGYMRYLDNSVSGAKWALGQAEANYNQTVQANIGLHCVQDLRKLSKDSYVGTTAQMEPKKLPVGRG